METKIFTFEAESSTISKVSVEANTLEEAKALVQKLLDASELIENMMTGPAGSTISVAFESGEENTDADYGSMTYMDTDRNNAEENMERLNEMDEDDGVCDECGDGMVEADGCMNENCPTNELK